MALLSLAVCVLVSVQSGVPFSELGVYFDGHRYLEIARSFPLPYPPEAWRYAGDAPGYPALIWLARVLLPDSWLNWGQLAVLVTWAGAAASAVAFCLLCRSLEMRPLLPGLLFVVGNARWIPMSASAHPEPVAMAFAIACLVAYLSDRLAACMVLLSCAVMCRFPALLLGLPIAVDLLVLRRRRDLRTLGWLTLPILVLGLWHLYLNLRIPGFGNVWQAHDVLWKTHFAIPFSALFAPTSPGPGRTLTYASIAFYLAAVAIGFRPAERRLWVLPMWVAVVVGFQLSLDTPLALRAFTRLAILAWPAALLIVWRMVGGRVPAPAVLVLCAVLAVSGVSTASQGAAWVRDLQRPLHWIRDAVERLDEDTPHWQALGKQAEKKARREVD